MAHMFLSSDLHLGHGNIIKYCNRPFRDAHHMNKSLIANIQSRMTDKHDTLIHIGDFCCKGRERGVDGVRTSAGKWEERIDRKIIHIVGNHDNNNGLNHAMEFAVIKIGQYRALLMHIPPLSGLFPTAAFDFVLCGHVHDRWKTQWANGVWFYNVGVDANKFMPVRIDEVIGLYQKEQRSLREVALN